MKSKTHLSYFRSKLDQLKGKRDQIEKSILDAKIRIKEIDKDVRKYEKVRLIIKDVGLKTQQQLSYNISELTTMALSAVMENPYDLLLEFEEKRNKTECKISFTRSDNIIDTELVGGGALDIAAFALRVASWSMQTPRSRNTLILDEPFKHLKGEGANTRVLDMLTQVSKKLGLQIIMVSDERVSRAVTVAATDRLFDVSIKKGISKVNVE